MPQRRPWIKPQAAWIKPQADRQGTVTFYRGIWALAAIWRRGTVFVLGLFAILATIELALSMSPQATKQRPTAIYRVPTPYVEFYQKPNYAGHRIVTNDAGFRYGPLPKAKPPNEIRIFFLSSSVGFNGSTNEHTIAGIMESLLSRTPLSEPRTSVRAASPPSKDDRIVDNQFAKTDSDVDQAQRYRGRYLSAEPATDREAPRGLKSAARYKKADVAFTAPSVGDNDRIQDRRIRVVNASGMSFTSTQSAVLLLTKIIDYDPDILVVFHGPESLYYPTTYESRAGYPFNFGVREHLHDRLSEKLGQLAPAIMPILRTNTMQHFHPDMIQSAIAANLPRSEHLASIISLEEYDPYIRTVVVDVAKIMRVASAYGIRTIVAVPPAQCSELLPGAVERLAQRVKAAVEIGPVREARYVNTVGLARELTSRGLWKPDGLHWNDEGNRMVAELLLDVLRDTGWLDDASTAAATR